MKKDGKKKKAKNKGGEEDTSLGNTYWICKEESEYEDVTGIALNLLFIWDMQGRKRV